MQDICRSLGMGQCNSLPIQEVMAMIGSLCRLCRVADDQLQALWENAGKTRLSQFVLCSRNNVWQGSNSMV